MSQKRTVRGRRSPTPSALRVAASGRMADAASAAPQRAQKRLPEALRPALPPKFMAGRAYEYTTVLYWPNSDDPRAGKRYAGHHAELLEERSSLARVAVFPQGTSDRPGVEAKTMWIDLSSAEHTDAGPHSLTEIGLGRGRKSGALYLISTGLPSPHITQRKADREDEET